MNPAIKPRADAKRPRVLTGLNPLAKIAAVTPAIAMLIFVRGVATPAAVIGAGLIVLLLGARLSRRMLTGLLIGLPLIAAIMTVSFALWTDPAAHAASETLVQVGRLRLTSGTLQQGAETALRVCAIVVLTLVPTLTTDAADLARSLVQQLRLPYRVGYTAIAAFQFVPMLTGHLSLIEAAHRARGLGSGRGPIAAIKRWVGWLVPLLAGGIRHAERVALAMDSRGFGAHPTRTERHQVPWRRSDTLFVVTCWVLTAVTLIGLWNR